MFRTKRDVGDWARITEDVLNSQKTINGLIQYGVLIPVEKGDELYFMYAHKSFDSKVTVQLERLLFYTSVEQFKTK